MANRIVHAMAHGLSALYDTPHGVACAILMPVGPENNKSVSGERYRAIGKAMCVEGIDAMSTVQNPCSCGFRSGIRSILG